MINIEEHAALLYQTYCAAVGGVAFNGDPLPDWESFATDPGKTKQADAWLAVARKSLNAETLATRGLESPPENHAGDGQPSGLPAVHGSASEKSPN